MTATPAVRMVLRGLAIAIALIAAADPTITSSRTVRPDVALTTSGSPRDSVFSNRVARALSKDFTVVRAPIAAAAATVIVGERLPTEANELASPAFNVFDDRDGPVCRSTPYAHPPPRHPTLACQSPSSARVTGARGRTLDVTLRANGLVVDRVTRAIASDDQRTSLSLTFVPTAPGAAPLRVSRNGLRRARSATTDIVVDVRRRASPFCSSIRARRGCPPSCDALSSAIRDSF